MPRGGFTLIELLIVIGIVAVLATIAVVVVNPVELFREAQDSARMTDVRSLDTAISLLSATGVTIDLDGPGFTNSCKGQPNQNIFVSVPSDNGETPPAAPAGWTWKQVTKSNLRSTNGTGWLPVSFTQYAQTGVGSTFSALPVDPTNTFASGLYYTYTCGSYEIDARLVSRKYQSFLTTDDGDDSTLWERGSDLTLSPVRTEASASPPVVPPPPSPAAGTYYVTPSGGGIHDGTSGNEFSLAEAKSFADEAEHVGNAYIFLLAPGEYGRFTEQSARTAGAWVTYQALNPADKPVFRGSGINAGIYIHDTASAYIKFIGIAAYAGAETSIEIENANYVTIADSYMEGTQTSAIIGYAVRIAGSNVITIDNSLVRYGKFGIVATNADNLAVTNNEIAFQQEDGLHFGDMSTFAITGNDIHDTIDSLDIYPESHQDSIQIDAGALGVRNGTIQSNRVTNSAGQGVFISRSGHVQSYVLENIAITNNLISGSFAASPFQIEGGNLTVTGNTVRPVGSVTSAIMETADNVTLRNNIFSSNLVNCGTNSTQDYNLIGTYLSGSGSCTPGSPVSAGVHDVVSAVIEFDSASAPLSGQIFSDASQQSANPCTMSASASYVGALPCSETSAGGVGPAVPANFSAVTSGTSQIVLSWADVSNETSYALEQSLSATSGFSSLSFPPANSVAYTNGGLNPSTTYYYRLKAANAVGTSAYTAVVSATTASAAGISGLIHHYSLDTSDITGGTLINAPAQIVGQIGQAFMFSNASDQYIRLSSSVSTLNQGSGAYTISAWVYPTDMSRLIGSHYGAGILKSIGNGGNGAQGDFFLSLAGNGELVFTNWQASGNQAGGRHYVDTTDGGNIAIGANAWYHVVATWDGSVNTMYINGASQSFLNTNTDSGYGLGSYIGQLVGSTSWEFNGGIDDVRIYGRALTPSEIQTIYASGLAGTEP